MVPYSHYGANCKCSRLGNTSEIVWKPHGSVQVSFRFTSRQETGSRAAMLRFATEQAFFLSISSVYYIISFWVIKFLSLVKRQLVVFCCNVTSLKNKARYARKTV